MEDKKKIGEKLKLLRTEKKLSVANCAAAVGVSESAWRMYELGERVPKDNTKIKIANFFKRSVSTIFFV